MAEIYKHYIRKNKDNLVTMGYSTRGDKKELSDILLNNTNKGAIYEGTTYYLGSKWFNPIIWDNDVLNFKYTTKIVKRTELEKRGTDYLKEQEIKRIKAAKIKKVYNFEESYDTIKTE